MKNKTQILNTDVKNSIKEAAALKKQIKSLQLKLQLIEKQIQSPIKYMHQCNTCKSHMDSCFIIKGNDTPNYYCCEGCVAEDYTEDEYVELANKDLADWFNF
jgi:chromosome segregation ATPase